MHYQTEERGRPNTPDYRIYFSKLIIAGVGHVMSAPPPTLTFHGTGLEQQGSGVLTPRKGKRLTFRDDESASDTFATELRSQ